MVLSGAVGRCRRGKGEATCEVGPTLRLQAPPSRLAHFDSQSYDITPGTFIQRRTHSTNMSRVRGNAALTSDPLLATLRAATHANICPAPLCCSPFTQLADHLLSLPVSANASAAQLTRRGTAAAADGPGLSAGVAAPCRLWACLSSFSVCSSCCKVMSLLLAR